MNASYLIKFAVGCLVAITMSRANADIALADFASNKDGAISTAPPGFNPSLGGDFSLTFTGTGAHAGYAFFDYDLSESINTFFNEIGSVSGVPSAGQSWEIDEPGFVFGDIYDNFLAGTLDNSVGTADPDDVSMAMGWNFILGPEEIGQITFRVTLTEPSGFYLRQFDPDSGEQIFLASSLEIRTTSAVPEGGNQSTLFAISAALLLATGWRFRKDYQVPSPA